MFCQQICRKLQFLSWVFTLTISQLVIIPTEISAQITPEIRKETKVFPVDLLIAGKDISTNVLVRSLSKEKSNHEYWLLPLDKVAQVLNLQVIPIDYQQLELRTPVHVVRVPTRELYNDPQLGLVVSLAKLQDLLAIATEVDDTNQTINLTPNWLASRRESLSNESLTLPPSPNVDINVISLNSVQKTISGEAFGGEWYVRTYQPDLLNTESIYVSEARYVLEKDYADYVVGIQPQSWLGGYQGNFLGFTTIQRWGFTPIATSDNILNYRHRLNSDSVGRTVRGKTTPGSVVKLTKVNSQNAIAETVANAEGEYSFYNVPSKPGNATYYQVLSYNPNNPDSPPLERKTIALVTVSEQLPEGASALLISGGVTQGFLEETEKFQTEIAYRYGLTEDLTMGINLGYSEIFRGVGELVYQPSNLPIQVSLSLLNSPDIEGWYLTSKVKLQPLSNLVLDFNSDRLTRNIALNWQATPQINLTINGNNHQSDWRGSVHLAYQNEYFAAISNIILDQQDEISWNITSRIGHFQLMYGDTPNRQNAELSYNLFRFANIGYGHWLFINHETYEFLKIYNNLTTIGWRYRSLPEADSEGFWEISCGYGVGNLGSGVILSVARELVPGLRLQLNYKTVSTLANDQALEFKIIPNFNIFSNSRQWQF